LIGFAGSILRAPAMAGYLSTYRGESAIQTTDQRGLDGRIIEMSKTERVRKNPS